MADITNITPLIPPSPMIKPNFIDLEASSSHHIQCRICLDSDGGEFIAPCKCKGSSKFVHRECLDHWRSVKEGFAFAHCTTCKAPYYLKVHALPDKKWRTLKFRFFVTRDIIFIFLIVQLVIISLAYLVYMVDGYQEFWLQHYWIFKNNISFYYLCGALLFFAFLGLSGCIITCFDTRVQNDLTQPWNEFCLCCCHPRACANVQLCKRAFTGTYCLWNNELVEIVISRALIICGAMVVPAVMVVPVVKAGPVQVVNVSAVVKDAVKVVPIQLVIVGDVLEILGKVVYH